MLAKYNIKSVSLPPRKICSYLPAAKDALGLRMPDVYSIPCECGKVYIGHVKLRCPGNHPKERIQHSQHGESLKSRNICFLPILSLLLLCGKCLKLVIFMKLHSEQ